MAADIDPTAKRTAPRTRIPLGFEEVAMAAGMAAIALITGANVLTRYLTDISLAFTEEYCVALMVVVTLVGAGYAAAHGAHIRIGFLVDRMPTAGRRAAELVATALLAVVFGLLAVFGAQLAWDDYRFEIPTPGLGHPQWLFTACLPLFSLGVVGRAIGRIARLLRNEAA
jgi:TRAP-type C4-dicarboxylate transport system permease small subunit